MPSGVAGSLSLLLLAAACAGCADPQPPEFSNFRISYESVAGDWVRVADIRDGVAEGSRVLLEGIITDNTAVVDPYLSLIAQRNDVAQWAQEPFAGSCRGEPYNYYACDLTCAKPPEGGDFYVCDPALPAASLIRGDRYIVALAADAGIYEMEVRVREAVRFDASYAAPEEEYRVLQLINNVGDPNPFLWGLRYRSRQDAQGNWLNDEPLRYGDALRLDPGEDAWFQLLVDETVMLGGTAYTLTEPPAVTWKSLFKWNQYFPLALDPKTGAFAVIFQFFDPRAAQAVADPEEAALYTFSVDAHDVPDQSDGKVRARREAYPVRFVPPAQGVPAPTLVINELGESGTVIEETSVSSYLLSGVVSSVAGEVKSLEFALSNEAGDRSRVHAVDAGLISLLGAFSVNVELVSDWGDGGGGDPASAGPVLNRLQVVAYDMRGQFTVNEYEFPFLPPAAVSPPALSYLEFFPTLGTSAEALLPAGESICMRAVASDNGGQPEASSQMCSCAPEEELAAINDARCECGEELPWSMDASGRFPEHPWEIIRMEPTVAQPLENLALLRAREPSGAGSPGLFAALGVTLAPDEAADAYAVTASLAVSSGPIDGQIAPANGSVLGPADDLTVQVSVLQNVLPVQRLIARYNGRRPEEVQGLAGPTVAFGGVGDYVLGWTFEAGQVGQGTRICLGGESVAGHQTIHLLEFTAVLGGWMVGVSTVTDEASCAP